MSEAAPAKAVRDPESFRDALDGWMRSQRPEATDLRVHDVDMPRATGFSNETVFFSASYRDAGEPRTERLVATKRRRAHAPVPTPTNDSLDHSLVLNCNPVPLLKVLIHWSRHTPLSARRSS